MSAASGGGGGGAKKPDVPLKEIGMPALSSTMTEGKASGGPLYLFGCKNVYCTFFKSKRPVVPFVFVSDCVASSPKGAVRYLEISYLVYIEVFCTLSSVECFPLHRFKVFFYTSDYFAVR